jgi:hypothetical protein
MNRIFAILALCFSDAVYAQTSTPMPPVVTLPMPAPSLTVIAGANVTISWSAVTESTTSTPLTVPVTYNAWEVSSGTPALKASGLTTLSNERMSLAVGTPCYVITASAAGDIDSAGSTPPVCVNVVAAPVQVASPTNVTISVTP